MKVFLLVASAALMALGSISVSVNAQSTGSTKVATGGTAKDALVRGAEWQQTPKQPTNP
ncbi:MAG: hypothetical protein ACO1TE_24050 [Prosthecobacter sp.]